MRTPVKLFAPEQFWRLTDAARKQLVNGCGPGGWKFDLVPDTVYGLSVRPACNIHDFMYAIGESIADKDVADRAFLNNMVRIINGRTDWGWLRWLRRRRALKYYWAVSRFGGPAFWSGKNPGQSEQSELFAAT